MSYPRHRDIAASVYAGAANAFEECGPSEISFFRAQFQVAEQCEALEALRDEMEAGGDDWHDLDRGVFAFQHVLWICEMTPEAAPAAAYLRELEETFA